MDPLRSRRAIRLVPLFVLAVIFHLNTSAYANLHVDDVLGAWMITIKAGGEIYSSSVEIEKDEKGGVAGRYSSDGRKSQIEETRFDGDTFFFEVRTLRFSRPVHVTFACEVNGDNMTGEVDFDSGTRSRAYDFEAFRKGGNRKPSEKAEEAAPLVSGGRQKVSFRQGVNGYNRAVDTEIWAIAPGKPLYGQGTMTTDGNNGGGESQVLLRFDEIIGAGKGMVPPKARVVSATLTVIAFDPGTTVYVHRLLVPWTRGASWDGLVAGISIDDFEASRTRDGFTFGQINMDKQSVQFNVTQTVQHWVDGASNFGWVFVNTGGNGWDFYSSDWIDIDLRPELHIEFEARQSQTQGATK